MRESRKGFTLIELVVGIAIGSFVILVFGNFLLTYYENSVDLKEDQQEFSDVTFGLKSLQKIIFENAEYITFNNEIESGGQCQDLITDGTGLGNLCHTKFGFVVENEGGQEEEYKVELIDCDLGKIEGKQLVYKNSSKTIPLLGGCIYSKVGYPIEHKVEFINDEIKEKVFRYYIYTENGIYKQTIFVH